MAAADPGISVEVMKDGLRAAGLGRQAAPPPAWSPPVVEKPVVTGTVVKSAQSSAQSPGSGPSRRSGASRGSLLSMHNEIASAMQQKVPLPDRTWFCAVTAVLVIANLQVCSLETDFGCTASTCTTSDRMPWLLFDHFFTLAFVVEIGLRIYGIGVKKYFRGDPLVVKLPLHVLHCLDLLVVLLMVLDVWCLAPSGIHTPLRLFSMFRIVHVARFVQRLALVPAFRELWLIISGVGDMMKSVFWVALMMVIIVWAFAIMLTMSVGKDSDNKYDFSATVWTKDDYFGTVPKSAFSLLQVLTTDKWSANIAWPVVRNSHGVVLIFFFFFCIASLLLLNTVVGIVVESTLTSAQDNQEKHLKRKQLINTKVMESMRLIFHEADTDKSGTLDMEELKASMKKQHVRDRMKMLEIRIKDLSLLFALFDEENSGEIPIDKFFRGCARLQGLAAASDLHRVSVDLQRNINAANKELEMTQQVNETLQGLLEHISVVDTDIVKIEADVKDPVVLARRDRAHRKRAAQEDTPLGKESRQNSKMSCKGSLVRASLAAAGRRQASESSDSLIKPPPPPPPLPGHFQEERGHSKQSLPARKSVSSLAGTTNKALFQWPN